jgi:L-malate glycosyltransferase
MIVHQFLPTFEPGAVGSHALLARAQLRAAGHTSEIYASEVRGAYANAGAHVLDAYRGGADVLVYQMAIGSVTADALAGRAEPLVVNYHNFTPLRYYAGWEHVAAHGIAWGRQQLRDMAARAALGLAVSDFNEGDLIEAGFARTAVVPFLLDTSALMCHPDPAVARHDETTWLFVGRLAPNKAQHDLVKALFAYRKFFDPSARLVLVGGDTEGSYGRTVARFVHALGLDDAVTMTGPVSGAALAGYYASADVLVVASEHEGFCVPLLEAMAQRVPVVAYSAAAIPETLGNAGVLLPDKDAFTLATAVHRVVTDAPLRDQLVAAGLARVPKYDVAITGPQFVEAVTSVAR